MILFIVKVQSKHYQGKVIKVSVYFISTCSSVSTMCAGWKNVELPWPPWHAPYITAQIWKYLCEYSLTVCVCVCVCVCACVRACVRACMRVCLYIYTCIYYIHIIYTQYFPCYMMCEGGQLAVFLSYLAQNIYMLLPLTRLPPRESTLDGRWTEKVPIWWFYSHRYNSNKHKSLNLSLAVWL